MNPAVGMTVDERVLRAVTFGITEAVPRGRSHMYREPEMGYKHFGNMLVARLERSVYGEEVVRRTLTETVGFERPATWWDMFKRDVLPKWAARWLSAPAYETVSKQVDMRTSVVALLPDYVPPEGTGPTVVVHEMSTSDFLSRV